MRSNEEIYVSLVLIKTFLHNVRPRAKKGAIMISFFFGRQLDLIVDFAVKNIVNRGCR